MKKQTIEEFMPVFNAIIQGKNVQIFDSLNLCFHNRGWWKTVDNWGFGASNLCNYRIKNKDGSIEYFAEQPKNRIHQDMDEYEKYIPTNYNY